MTAIETKNELRGTLGNDNNLSGKIFNAKSGGSSGRGTTHILDFDEFFKVMSYPSIAGTDNYYRLKDMVEWGQISQEFVDKLYKEFGKIDNNNIGVIGIASDDQGSTYIEYPYSYSFQDYEDGWVDRTIILKREEREGSYIKVYVIEISYSEENGIPDDVYVDVIYVYKLTTS